MNLTLTLRQKKAGAFAQLKFGPHLLKEVRMGDTIEFAEQKLKSTNDSFYTAYRSLESLKRELDDAGWKPKTLKDLRDRKAFAAERLEQITMPV